MGELSRQDISRRLAEERIGINPAGADAISGHDHSKELLEKVVSTYESGEIIDEQAVKSIEVEPSQQIQDSTDEETESEEYDPFERALIDELPDVASRVDADRAVAVTKDITGKSRGTGEIEDFSSLFRDRYTKLRDILSQRVKARPIKSLTSRRGSENVGVIGMVRETRTSNNGNPLVEVEDRTGDILVVFSDDSMKETLNEVVEDEVVAIRGQLSDNAEIMFGDDILFPEIPPRRTQNTASRSAHAVLVSDLHFGAEQFSYKAWRDFVRWVRQNEKIEYILVSGDIVEGIGVYPGQKQELDVVSIHEQYRLAAEAFNQIPDDVKIIMSVGNHDSVRLAEPQPTLPEKFREYFNDNVEFVGNPSLVTVEGVDFLLYHGMSLNALEANVPGVDLETATSAMKLLLRKRHLSPVYGENVRLAPEEEDYLVIEQIPDVLHCGHVHTFSQDKHNGVLMYNTGAWQEQTKYQKQRDIEPDVGYAPKINLRTMKTEVFHFRDK